ncbi:LppM family (lipo)protein [Demequina aestuarii]|uniref:LppM family (lipo)protein n=1 Tax=Demequina aestuarii TaxID=327095 RepID=UPI000B0D1254|nr:hypothetical protein [Demequina aestuarii]
MRTLTRGLALAVVSTLALTGCVRVEMNVTLDEDDTASGDFIFAMSQELLEIAGEESLDDLLGGEETIPGGTTERYESEDENGDGSPDFVGTQTTFSGLPLEEFDAAGDGLRIFRDGDDYVVSGTADDLTDQTGGEELPETASATMSVTFPGTVSDHNGELDGTTVTWDLLEQSGELQARGSASADGGFPLWLILVIAALVGIGAGVASVLIVSSRRKSVDESQVSSPEASFEPGTDAPAGDPIDAPPVVAPTPAADPTDPADPATASAVPETTDAAPGDAADASSTDDAVQADDAPQADDETDGEAHRP